MKPRAPLRAVLTVNGAVIALDGEECIDLCIDGPAQPRSPFSEQADAEIAPYRRLWWRMVQLAIDDARSTGRRAEDARAWLAGGEFGGLCFDDVCAALRLDPDAVRDVAGVTRGN